MKEILHKHRKNIALLIGNGINLYEPSEGTNSWHDLLMALANKHLPDSHRSVPDGVALTEFYDVLDLKVPDSVTDNNLQKGFCELMSEWAPYQHHENIVKWAQDAGAPILTTNFERVLSDAGECKLYRTRKKGFTDFYPWESYYAPAEISDPSREFAIWHLNGMQRYHRSIRLGLSHYMGSVERARGWLHRGSDEGLYSGKNQHNWAGSNSWLHVIFNTPLLIFGLALDENEVFIRWMLIERARYFKKYPRRSKKAWYVYKGKPISEGKKYFLEGVGVETRQVPNYSDLYGKKIWT